MNGQRWRMWRRRGLAALGSMVLAVALAACGQTGVAGPPDTLAVKVVPHGGGSQTYNVSDATTVQRIYQHISALPIIPANAGIPCRATRQSYQFAFSAGGAHLLTAAIVQCANILQLPNNVSRAPDTEFWQLIDGAIGKQIEPV